MANNENVTCEFCNFSAPKDDDDFVTTDPIYVCGTCQDAETNKWHRTWLAAGAPGSSTMTLGQTFDCTGDETCPDRDAQFGHITGCPYISIDNFDV